MYTNLSPLYFKWNNIIPTHASPISAFWIFRKKLSEEYERLLVLVTTKNIRVVPAKDVSDQKTSSPIWAAIY